MSRTLPLAPRERLRNRRQAFKITFVHEGIRYHGTIGRYDDGRIAEVFLAAGKPGDAIDLLARDLAVLASIAFQHGAPVQAVRSALAQENDGTPRGPLGALLDAAETGLSAEAL